MKIINKIKLTSCIFALLLLFGVPTIKVQAAKVVKVKVNYEMTEDHNKQYQVYSGISSNGDTIWKYKTSKQENQALPSSVY